MNQEQLQYFRKMLQDEKRELRERVAGINGGGLEESLSGSVEEFAVYDQHPGDVGSEVFERSKDFALRETEMLKLEAIDHALHRMEEGKYGICENCGREISPARLEAVPYTTKCYDCKEERESLRSSEPARPAEEDVMERAPVEDTGFDGEDSWQAVARWQENAPGSGAGAYYGPTDTETGETGFVEEIDSIPYQKKLDGQFYEDVLGMDDESAPGGTNHLSGSKKKNRTES